MISRKVGKAIKYLMPFYISQTIDNLKEVIQKQLEEFKKSRIMNDFRNEMATDRDFTTCDVPKFDGMLDPIASTRWLSNGKGAFRARCCKEKNNVNFSLNFLCDSAKMWWDGKVCEKEFQTLMQTNETVNELWKKFNDLISYCLEYHENEKLKVEIFQSMLRDEIRDVISPCTTLDDLLSRAWVKEADLLRKKNKEETKGKLEIADRDVKKPKNDHGQRSGETQTKTPCKKCHKTYLGECQANLSGCYKCGALNHMSKDCKKPMILCYNCNQLGNNSNECLNPRVIEAKPLKWINEQKLEKTGVQNLKARVYVMAAEKDKMVQDVTAIILVNFILARALYDSSASVSFVSYKFRKNLSTLPNKLPSPLEVEIVDSKVVVVSNVYHDVEIEINDSTFRIDFIPIMLGVFDIVIGVDWLDKYNATILCSQKLIRVVNPQGREIIIYDDKKKGDFKLCYVMKAKNNVKELLLEEAHKLKYSIHPGATKMYLDLKKNYWWPDMKSEIVARHGVPVSIVSDRDRCFTSNFWQDFQEELGKKMNMGMYFHPQRDVQSERTIQTLEDILQSCVITFGGNKDDHLPLVEFAYNNSYHSSIKMPPYEMLYGRRCQTPVCWEEVGSRELHRKGISIRWELEEKMRIRLERQRSSNFRRKSCHKTERVNETYKNVSQDIRDQLNAKAEAVQIILTGIDNDIYSTVDACLNACEMWKAIERSQQAATRNRGIATVNTPQPIYDQEPSMVDEDDEKSKDKKIDKLMALISLSFKKIYKPTNNNLRTSSNTSRANQDNSPRIYRGTGYENQKIGNVVGARENVGSSVVQKSGIQCYNCKEFRHVARECQKPKREKDAAYHREKMLLYQKLEAHYMYMAQLQQVSPDAGNSGPIFNDEPLQKVSNDDHYNVFAMESTHTEQSKSMHDTYPIEQDTQNVITD
nr:zinc finger, CCHC-type, retrotransposon Gag domain protein [Tanacetum cinerariifolium]